jgi:hypothetical protein
MLLAALQQNEKQKLWSTVGFLAALCDAATVVYAVCSAAGSCSCFMQLLLRLCCEQQRSEHVQKWAHICAKDLPCDELDC